MIIVIKILAFLNTNYKALYLLYQGLELLYKFLKNNDMGLWSKKAEKGFSQFVDDQIKLPIWAEPFDGLIVNYGIAWLDNKYSSDTPDVLKPTYIKIGKVFEEYNSNKKLKIEEFITVADITVILNSLIDIPGLTEDEEAILMAAILQGVFTLIKNYLGKKQVQKEAK